MKTKYSFVIILSASLLFLGCSSTHNTKSNSDITLDENKTRKSVPEIIVSSNDESERNEIYRTNFPTYSQLSKKYPDKVVLVWLIEETLYERNYSFYTSEVNDYLDTLGYNYCVCFLPMHRFVWSWALISKHLVSCLVMPMQALL